MIHDIQLVANRCNIKLIILNIANLIITCLLGVITFYGPEVNPVMIGVVSFAGGGSLLLGVATLPKGNYIYVTNQELVYRVFFQREHHIRWQDIYSIGGGTTYLGQNYFLPWRYIGIQFKRRTSSSLNDLHLNEFRNADFNTLALAEELQRMSEQNDDHDKKIITDAYRPSRNRKIIALMVFGFFLLPIILALLVL